MDVEIFRKGVNPSKNDRDSFMVIVRRCSERFAPKLGYQNRTFQSIDRGSFIKSVPPLTCPLIACQVARPFVWGKTNHTVLYELPPWYTQSPVAAVTQFPLKCTSAEGSSSGESTWSPFLPASSLVQSWDDKWKLSVMHHFLSCPQALPPAPANWQCVGNPSHTWL